MFWSARVSVVKVFNAAVDFARLSWEVQGSLPEVKLASALITSDALEAFHIGSMVTNVASTDIASVDFSRLSLIRAFVSVARY